MKRIFCGESDIRDTIRTIRNGWTRQEKSRRRRISRSRLLQLMQRLATTF